LDEVTALDHTDILIVERSFHGKEGWKAHGKGRKKQRKGSEWGKKHASTEITKSWRLCSKPGYFEHSTLTEAKNQ